jgi:hypothetical protein
MDPWAPINGISLERYAELAADVAETQDPAKQAEIVGQKGVGPGDWEAAKAGWTARMKDMSLMGQVASRFMPLYQAALARKSPTPQIGYEDYVAICGCPPVMGIEATLAHYRLTMTQWTQIAGHWNGIIATDPQYMQHGMRVEQEAARIRAGGAPRPVAVASGGAAAAAPAPAPRAEPESATHAVSGAMPGALPPPGYGAAPAHPGYPPQPGYPASPAPGHVAQQAWPQAAPGYAQPGYNQPGYNQPGYNQQAVAFGNQVGSAFNAFGNALGSFVNSAITPLAPGAAVRVQWSDGQYYPGTVILLQNGQVQVAFPDGRQVWVPQQYVTPR